MKIINFELNPNEDVSLYQTGHCGGTCFSRHAKELLNNDKDEFWIVGQESNFKNIQKSERYDRLIQVDHKLIEFLKNGYPVKHLGKFFEDADIIIHNYGEISLNLEGLKAKQVCWYSFVGQSHHPNTPYGFIYSYDQRVIFPQNTKVYKVKIGSYIPDKFEDIKHENYLFQCTRLDHTMDPIPFVKLCNKYQIKGFFAGPILHNYPILEHIDNKNTFYLGTISEEKKLELCKRARLFNSCQNWDTIFNLSSTSAMGQGCPIIAYNRGCFKYIVKEGVNGFYYNGEENNFLDIWEKADKIDRRQVWESSKEWSHIEMVNSFYKGFEEILHGK